MAAPMSFGIQVITPLLSELMSQQPKLYINLQLDDRQTDLLRDGIDLSLRIGKSKDSTLIATRLCDISFGYFASPQYIDQHGEPINLEDLANHQCLRYNLMSPVQEWGIADKNVPINGRLSTNNGKVLCKAAIGGLGIVSLPRFLAQEALLNQQLKPVLIDVKPQSERLYAICLSRQFTPRKTLYLIDYLKDALQKSNF